MSCELAEFIGVMYGDGNLHIDNKHSYRLVISLNKDKDAEYAQFIQKRFTELFGLQLRTYTYKNKSLLMLRCYSKKLVYHLHEEFNLPIGKKQHLGIPAAVQESNYAFAFIRGLIDTDGCTYTRTTQGYSYPVVKFTNTNQLLAHQVAENLRSIGMQPVITRKHARANKHALDVVLNGQKQLRMYQDFIGTNNPRNKKGTEGFEPPICR